MMAIAAGRYRQHAEDARHPREDETLQVQRTFA